MGNAEGQAGSAEGQAVLADVPNYATGGVVSLNYEIRTG